MVTCGRCGTDYAEDSDSVTWVYRDQEWRCTYGDECDEALLESHAEGGIDGF